MRNSELRRALLAGVVALALGAWAGRAEASAFQLVEQSGSGIGNAYSGQAAAAEDASTVYWNPAGMTRIPRRQLVAAGNLITLMTDFQNRGSTGPTGAPATGGDGGDAGDPSFIPNLYFTAEALPGVLWAGLGLNVPFGLKTDWDAGWVGRFHALKSEVRTINVNPAVAWKLNPWVSVGAGVNYQWIDAELSNSVFVPVPGVEPRAKLDADDTSWGWNVGAMFEFPTNTRVGVSYRSKIEHELEGDVEFTGVPPALAAALPNGDIRADIELPDTFSVAVAQQVMKKLQLLADFTWTGWSSIPALTIFRSSGAPLTSTPLAFDDSWRIGLGANYQFSDPWKLRLGVAYDTTPVQSAERTPRLPDQDRTWIAGGLQWAFSKNGAIDVGAAYLFIKEASSNLPNVTSQPAGFPPSARGNLVGTYDASVFIASAQAKYSF